MAQIREELITCEIHQSFAGKKISSGRKGSFPSRTNHLLARLHAGRLKQSHKLGENIAYNDQSIGVQLLMLDTIHMLTLQSLLTVYSVIVNG